MNPFLAAPTYYATTRSADKRGVGQQRAAHPSGFLCVVGRGRAMSVCQLALCRLLLQRCCAAAALHIARQVASGKTSMTSMHFFNESLNY